MTQGIPASSDDIRSSLPLRHAQHVTFDQPIRLERGGELPSVTVAFETHGKLNAARDNAVLICHALSGDSHVARHSESDAPGWWDLVVGPGKAIDTNRYFVICPNVLGGCSGTTGPYSTDPRTGKPYAHHFPLITLGDMVDVQRMLVDHLGIEKLLAVVGGSLGGHQALTWATRYPDKVGGTVALATSPRLTSQALAFDIVGRNAIMQDPSFQGGDYYDSPNKPDVGLAIARMLGHITYLSREAMTAKFEPNRLQPFDIATDFEKTFSVGSYLAHQGDKFVERFDANSYLRISMAMDLFDLGSTREELAKSFEPTSCRWLVVSFSSDWLFPPFQSRDMVSALVAARKRVSYCEVTTNAGHDAFLLEDGLDRYGELIRGFLGNLHAEVPQTQDDQLADQHEPTSIYAARRLDYEHILDLVEAGATVLDLGCGRGGLLARLQQREHQRVMGVEVDEHAIVTGVRRNLDVVHYDLNQGLPAFTDQQFDYVVLSQALQAVANVEQVIDEMLRVGRRCIVSFPNIAHEPLRKRLAEQGRAPVPTGDEPGQWFNTPNIRFCSIEDFDAFCQSQRLRVHRAVYLDTQAGRLVDAEPNLHADTAIYVLSR